MVTLLYSIAEFVVKLDNTLFQILLALITLGLTQIVVNFFEGIGKIIRIILIALIIAMIGVYMTHCRVPDVIKEKVSDATNDITGAGAKYLFAEGFESSNESWVFKTEPEKDTIIRKKESILLYATFNYNEIDDYLEGKKNDEDMRKVIDESTETDTAETDTAETDTAETDTTETDTTETDTTEETTETENLKQEDNGQNDGILLTDLEYFSKDPWVYVARGGEDAFNNTYLSQIYAKQGSMDVSVKNITYYLDGAYTSMTGSLFIPKEAIRSTDAYGYNWDSYVTFYVTDENDNESFADRKQGFSERMRPEEIEIDLTGAQFLRIEFSGTFYNEMGMAEPLVCLGNPTLY